MEAPLNTVVREGEAGAAVIVGITTPVGAVTAYAGRMNESVEAALASQGWLLCDGDAVSRARYKALYDVMGTSHGVGDGRLSFNLPDYRGRFLRGVAGASGRDPHTDERQASGSGGRSGNVAGSVQPDSVGLHEHAEVGMMEEDSVNIVIGSVDPRPGMVQTQQAARGGGTERETRPKNIYVHYLVFAGLQPQPEGDAGSAD